MGVDYYKILQVDRNAKDDDLRKAYLQAKAKFNQISVAYDVLSDSQKRAVYDQCGEEGLKGHGGDGPNTFRINPQSVDSVFSEFFGSRATTSSSGFSKAKGMSAEDFFSSFRGVEGQGSGMRKGPTIERNLPCSLEDLYKGTSKKMKISRDVILASGRATTIEELLTIEIKPGWKKGTKITFPEKGNEQQGVIPSDLSFIIDEKPHSVFKREDNDLIVTQKISVVEALTDYTAQVTTLDGRNLTITINSIISPAYEEVVKGEGMPIPKERSRKGNLRITFNILPMRLTSEQKTGIKRLLTSS
uniref:J domain-containing protein n=1 Tax=Davidia involucrata TaxID=16924 RepID=A0A5B6ZQM1_DAVIN